MAGWTAASLPLVADWQDVTYGNGKFVAVGEGGYSAYSADGVNWNVANMPSSANWKSIAYGNGKFVTIAYPSSSTTATKKAAYSSDGITWTAVTLPLQGSWISITYGGGKFVAVSFAGAVAYSADGESWSSAKVPDYDYIACLASVSYGNGKFLTVSQGTGSSGTEKAYYSTDGSTWFPVSLPTSLFWKSVTYGNGKFVAIGETSKNVGWSAYSADGISWTIGSSFTPTGYWNDVTYGNGKFVAISKQRASNVETSRDTAYSEDGITWVYGLLPSYQTWTSVTYGDGKFVAIAASSSMAAYIPEDFIGSATLKLETFPDKSGTVTGAGTFTKGTSVTVKATPADGWEFVAWTENGSTVSTSSSYTFTVTSSRNLTAVFKQKLTAWVGVANKARKGVELYVGVNGKARKVTAAYIGVSGKARRFL